jgi:hypothetical protein
MLAEAEVLVYFGNISILVSAPTRKHCLNSCTGAELNIVFCALYKFLNCLKVVYMGCVTIGAIVSFNITWWLISQ